MVTGHSRLEVLSLLRRGRADDAAMSRFAIESCLERWHREDISQSSTVLIVRRVQCSVMGNIDPCDTVLADALAEQAGDAARYRRGNPPIDGCDSVVFHDRAESLACFICDLVCGTVARWWWASYRRHYPAQGNVSAEVARVLADNLLELPGIIDYLRQWRLLAEVFGRVSDAHCEQLMEMMGQHLRLPQPMPQFAEDVFRLADNADAAVSAHRQNRAVGEQPRTSAVSDGVEDQQESSASNVALSHSHWSMARTATPYRQLISTLESDHRISAFDTPSQFVWAFWRTQLGTDLPAALHGSARHLVGAACLALKNLPQLRSRSFQDVFQVIGHPHFSARFGSLRTLAQAAREEERPVHSVPTSTHPSPRPPTNFPKESIAPSAEEPSRPPVSQTAESRTASRSSRHGNQSTNDVNAATRAQGEREGAVTTRTSPFADSASDCIYYTQFGGVLYLVNLLNHCEFPEAFLSERQQEGLPSNWTILALMGRYLLSRASVDCELDALWSALFELAGAAHGDSVGQGFTGEETFDLPHRVQQSVLEERPLRFGMSSSRVWATCGDVLLHAGPRRGRSAADIRLSLAQSTGVPAENWRLSAFDDRPQTEAILGKMLPCENDVALRHWLGAVFPALKAVFDSLLSGLCANPTDVLQCPGRLAVTRTHVDFHASLDHISLPARCAGLDQNPGWCAPLGRVVSFHFHSG